MPTQIEAQRDLSNVIYKIVHDTEFKKAFAQNPTAKLSQTGITDTDTQQYILDVLNNSNFSGQESVRKTMDLADRFKESIKESLDQVEHGYKRSMTMYWIAFLTGILLIITAIVFAITEKQNLLSIIFGSLGTLDLLVFFIAKPPLELQNSRIGFARLEAAYMNWFIDLTNLNGLLLMLTPTYGTINPQTGMITVEKENFDAFYEKTVAISKQSIENTDRTLQMMGTIIREAAEKK